MAAIVIIINAAIVMNIYMAAAAAMIEIIKSAQLGATISTLQARNLRGS
jgi:hypothetical protein